RAALDVATVGIACETVAVEREVMHAAVALDLDERLQARLQLVGKSADAAKLVEVAVVVGDVLAVRQGRVLVDGAVHRAAGGELEAVEALVEAEGAAERRIDGIIDEAGLDVRAARIVGRDPQAGLRGEIEILGHVEAAIDMA